MDDKVKDIPGAVSPLAETVSSPGTPFTVADRWRPSGHKTMARKKVSTTIYIEPEQLELLKVLNERTKVPMAEYIREGIDLVLSKHRDKLPGQLALDAVAAPSPAVTARRGASEPEGTP